MSKAQLTIFSNFYENCKYFPIVSNTTCTVTETGGRYPISGYFQGWEKEDNTQTLPESPINELFCLVNYIFLIAFVSNKFSNFK